MPVPSQKVQVRSPVDAHVTQGSVITPSVSRRSCGEPIKTQDQIMQTLINLR